jgi:hypothetical protein
MSPTTNPRRASAPPSDPALELARRIVGAERSHGLAEAAWDRLASQRRSLYVAVATGLLAVGDAPVFKIARTIRDLEHQHGLAESPWIDLGEDPRRAYRAVAGEVRELLARDDGWSRLLAMNGTLF